MLARILLPLDGSEVAETIMGQLGRLLRIKDAEVILVQAVPVPLHVGLEYAPITADLQAESEAYMAALVKNLCAEGVKARSIVRVGGEAHTILEVARETGATLIAMATHGRTGLSRFVFGSVAEKVIRASEVPVLIMRSFDAAVPGAARTRASEVPFRRILLPVDGSEAALGAVPQLAAFAKACGAEVRVLGVVPAVGSKPGDGEPLVHKATQILATAGVPVDPVVRLGDPASEILDASGRHEVDLIAMSTHGRSGVSRWVLGSVTEKVLRGSTVPMLLFRTKT
ncbi:MAG: universal stress protein [Candidatus Brocadiae bacterium]|nr:universal stress protein [Candidatus Brocadiia bacterium]